MCIRDSGYLEQADGTAWMAMFSLKMLQLSLEIAKHDSTYEDMATKYFEHFIYITEALNKLSDKWVGSWDEKEGFFYDILVLPNDSFIPIKIRSLVGLMTLNAVLHIDKETIQSLPQFYENVKWFVKYRRKHRKYQVIENFKENEDFILSLVPKKRMKRLLNALIDEKEFLSPYGIRSLSKKHTKPYKVTIENQEFSVQYTPAESDTFLFGGDSNWRGPIWIPTNFLFLLSLKEYHRYYGDKFTVPSPNEIGKKINLSELSELLNKRLISMFEKNEHGDRPINKLHADFYREPYFKDLVLFYEYFHGDNGRGVGAAHQTGWTGVIAHLIHECC